MGKKDKGKKAKGRPGRKKDGMYYGGGAKSKYDPDYHPKQAYALTMLGASRERMGENFGVTAGCIEQWMKKYPELRAAILKGREEADARVVMSLYERACGYQHKHTHITNYLGEITKTEVIKRYPPDVQAAIFWLINRTRHLPPEQRWINKQDIDHISSDGSMTPKAIENSMEPKEAASIYFQMIKNGKKDDE